MTHQKRMIVRLISMVFVVIFVIQPALHPVGAAARSSQVVQPVPQSSSLVRGPSENLDSYLQRAAATNPQVFQEAALAAVQDVFNGQLPDAQSETAMDEQIAYYLHRAALGLPLQSAPPQTSSTSAIQGDTYLWNGSQAGIQPSLGSDWQMTARPGGDPGLFAQQFEALIDTDGLPAGLPANNAAAVDAAGSADANLRPSSVALHAALLPTTGAESAVVDAAEIPVIRSFATAGRAQSSTAPAQTTNPASADAITTAPVDAADLVVAAPKAPQVDTPVQTLQANLVITATAPITTSYSDVITYTVVITNSAGSPASLVEMTQILPANGIFKGPVPTCAVRGTDKVICAIGNLNVGQSKTLEIPVEMKGNGVLTSTLTVKDTFNTVNPMSKAATATIRTEVTSTNRSQREVGKIVIAAEEFKTNTGETEAEGAVEIGYKKDGKYIYHLRLGPEDTIAWNVLSVPTIITTTGSLSQIIDNFPLFKGEFGVDVTKDSPLIIPSTSITPKLEQLAGFKILNTAVITQVAVNSGVASFSAELAVSLPGITTTLKVPKPLTFTTSLLATPTLTVTPPISGTVKKNILVLTGVINPGGKAEATIPEFELFFAGMKVKVKDATFTGDAIKIKKALLTMPEKFGELTGIISQIEITANSLTFGGVGVKIPLPNIYPLGKPITSTATLTPTALLGTNTQPYTPAISFIKNSATIMYETKGGFSLQLDSTLDLHLPDNNRKIPVEFKIDSQGNLKGTIKEIELKIAGQTLVMKNVEVDNAGLKVEEATLTITFPAKKKDEPTKDPTPAAALALATTPAAMLPMTETAKKDKDKQLAVIVKNVSITKNGFALGSIGVESDLPDFGLGNVVRFSKNKFKLIVNDPTTKPSFEIELQGTLKIQITGSEVETKFTAKWDKNGKFSGKLSTLTLTVATAKLVLTNVEFDSSRFTTNLATLTLPDSLGRTQVIVSKVVIDEKGLSFGDAAVKIPVKFTIGKVDGEPSPTNSVSISGTLGLILAQDKSYSFAFEGKVTIKLAAQSAEAEGKVSVDTKGEVRGAIESFELVIAGMTLAVKSASIENGMVKAQEATFSVPKEWGGLSVSVYQVEISSKGFSIGGGSFKLPEIKVGDMSLTLQGTLKKEGDGWLIAAGGELKLPNAGGAGCSGLGVSVEIFAGSNQQLMIEIAPVSADATEALAFQLRKVGVSLRCTIPLGTSGFDLTRIEGTVTLTSNVTKIEMRATIESKLGIGGFRAVTADGNMSVEYVKNPYKFEIGIGASMKIFSMFEAARASATMRFTDGNVPFLFKAEMNINAVIARGNVQLTAWTRDGQFNLVGRIYGEVGVKRGALVDRCWNSWLFGQGCLRIPSDDWFIGAGMEFGKFRQDYGDAWGFKAMVRFYGVNYGVYVDTDGRFRVGNVDQYRLIDAPSVQRARDLHARLDAQSLNRAVMSPADLALVRDYRFVNDEIIINTVELTRPGDLMLTMLRVATDSDVQVTLVRPDGLRISGSNPSGNVTFNESLMDSRDIRDPETHQPLNNAPAMIQTNINITNAALGQWSIVLNREPTAEFIIDVSGTVYGPPVAKLAISGQNDSNNVVDLAWTQSTPLSSTVTIYATQDTITDTASYTKTAPFLRPDGIMASQTITVELGTVTKFGGYPVAEFAYDGGAQAPSESLDLESLKSGGYRLWLEVDDGENPPTRRYFPGTATVLHPWDEAWTTTTVITPERGALSVAWDAHPNPDVDGYEIHITANGDDADEDTYIVDVGDVRSQTVTGLSAQQTYTVVVVGYDSGTGRTSEATSVVATPSNAPFTFTANPAALTIQGGSGATTNLTLASAVNPYPDEVFLEVVDVPDGIDFALATDVLTPTVSGIQSSLVISPSATLPSGVYTVTVVALSNGDERQIQIPITVQEPNFTLRTSASNLTLVNRGSTSVAIDATYQFGERDAIFVELLDVPEGVDWSIAQPSFLPGQKATLILTDTGSLAFGDYELTLLASDNEHAYTTTLALAVTGFGIATNGDSQARPAEVAAPFVVELDGEYWTSPINLAFDPSVVEGQFATYISDGTTESEATVNVNVIPLADTPPGTYELLLHATSDGFTETLPLYVTVQTIPTATDMALTYQPFSGANIVAGQTYSYTLAPQNISLNPALDVDVIDRTFNDGMLTLQNASGCSVAVNGAETVLSCDLGNVMANTQATPKTITWQVNPAVAAGTVIAHEGEVVVNNTAVHTETSTLDNLDGLALTVERQSDLALAVQASPQVTAGQPTTLNAVVTNTGPSYADDAVVSFFLPDGASLQTASAGCVQEAEFVRCPLGVLALNQQRTLAATVLIEPDLRGIADVLVAVDSASFDPDLGNNSQWAVMDVVASAQLSVSMTPNRTAAVEGDTVEYLIAINNQGPSKATNVGIELDLPASADIVDVQVADVVNTFEQLDINPGETLTATVAILFLEDGAGQPISLTVAADADEAARVAAAVPSITVANANPTGTFPTTMIVTEGEFGIISVQSDDPGFEYDPLAVAWDLNNDGDFDDAEGAIIRFDARAIDGPTTRLVAAEITDDDGGQIIVSGTVIVNNAAPMVDAGRDQFQRYDQPFTVEFDTIDAFANDLKTARIEWGDGQTDSLPLAAQITNAQATHTYAAIGVFPTKVCVTDDDQGEGCDEVVLHAMCRDNGLLVRLSQDRSLVTITLENPSGNLAIPAGMPFTLYNGNTVLSTFTLDQPLAVGATRTIQYLWANAPFSATLRLAVDDNGTGTKTTDLCSGSVYRWDTSSRIYLPIILK